MRVILILLIVPSFLWGQKNNRVEAYFLNINEAESHIMQADWNTASIIYEEAFNQTINPLFSHIVNYLNCVILNDYAGIKKTRKLTYWINYLMNQKGVHWEYLESHLIENFLIQEIKKDFCYTRQKDTTHVLADSMLLQIFHDDQNIRPDRPKYTQEDRMAIDSMDKVNWERYKAFIKRFGFPGEQNVSISLGEQELWVVNATLLRHFVQQGFGEAVIHILQKEFENLIIPRNIIASIYDMEYDMSKGKKKHYSHVVSYITFVGANIHKPIINYSEENIALINQNRSKLYLHDFDLALQYAVCGTMCVKGQIKKFLIEPYVYMDALPSFLFESEEEQKRIKSLKITPSTFVEVCPCNEF